MFKVYVTVYVIYVFPIYKWKQNFLKKKKKQTPKNSSPLDGEAHYKTSQETGH